MAPRPRGGRFHLRSFVPALAVIEFLRGGGGRGGLSSGLFVFILARRLLRSGSLSRAPRGLSGSFGFVEFVRARPRGRRVH